MERGDELMKPSRSTDRQTLTRLAGEDAIQGQIRRDGGVGLRGDGGRSFGQAIFESGIGRPGEGVELAVRRLPVPVQPRGPGWRHDQSCFHSRLTMEHGRGKVVTPRHESRYMAPRPESIESRSSILVAELPSAPKSLEGIAQRESLTCRSLLDSAMTQVQVQNAI